MEIRRTREEDLEELFRIYQRAREFMAARGNPNQWGEDYPPRDRIRRDAREGISYVCTEKGEIAAVFCYLFGEDEDYKRIYEGAWLNGAPYGVVHRLASSGRARGAAGVCLDWAYGRCKNLRIDTHRDNLIMQRLLKKQGFARCGKILVRDGGERIAYHKEEKQKKEQRKEADI